MGRASDLEKPIDRVFRWGTATGDDDGRLLERFLAGGDESAFTALVTRHGPMVLGVCRRILRDDRDVEDAFQATFLILVRRGGTIRAADRVGPWIHGVAHRVAVRARADAARRFVREGAGLDADPATTHAPPGRDAERSELRAILDEELGRLPHRLRAPLVLCHLEGLTHDQAAIRLRQPVGTIRSRLSRGRDKLRDRLARRGVSADDAALGSLVLFDAVPSALLESTVRSALAFASTRSAASACASAGAAALAQGALDAMSMPHFKLAAIVLGSAMTLGGASGFAVQDAPTRPTPGDRVGERLSPPFRAGTPPSRDSSTSKIKEYIDEFETKIRKLTFKRYLLDQEIRTISVDLAILRAQLERDQGASTSGENEGGGESITYRSPGFLAIDSDNAGSPDKP